MSLWYEKTENKHDKLGELVNRKGIDITYTKPSMAQYLIEIVVKKNPGKLKWMEPCKGAGAFFNNFPSNIQGEWCEITEGVDYLEYQGQVDITISNPPFVPRKVFWEFMLKAMDTTTHKIYWLLNLSSINVFTPRRLDIMEEKGWYIQSFHIVQDKRWYGRYSLVEIGREDIGVMKYCPNNF